MGKRLDLSGLVYDQAPISEEKKPSFRGDVTREETRARGTFKDEVRDYPDGRRLLGQVNTVTNEFRPYGKEFQPPPVTKLTPELREEARQEALKKARLAMQIKDYTKAFTGTGTFGPLFAALPIGATATKDAQAAIDNLKEKGTFGAVVDMYKKTGGRNPFAPMTNFETNIIAGSVLPKFGIDLSDELNVRSANEVIDAARKANRALGFTDQQFNNDLARLMGRANKSSSEVDALLLKYGRK